MNSNLHVGEPHLHDADVSAIARIASSRPQLVGIELAKDVLVFQDKTLLHAGPPLPTGIFPTPLLNSAAAASVYEGWASSFSDANAKILSGSIKLASAQDFRCVVPLASVLSPSQFVQVVEDHEGPGLRSYSSLNGGSGAALRLGLAGDKVVSHLEWLNSTLAECLLEMDFSAFNLIPIADKALTQGDDCHGQTQAGTRLLIEAFIERGAKLASASAFEFLRSSPSFFLNLWMAASKCMLGAAEGIDGSAVITAIGGNGHSAGLQLSGLPGIWTSVKVSPPDGPIHLTASALPVIGDSCVVEAFGLGAMAMNYSPAQQQALSHHLSTTPRVLARKLLSRVHPGFPMSGARFGTSARTILGSKMNLVVALGILDKSGQDGRIGAGIWHVPRCLVTSAMQRTGTH